VTCDSFSCSKTLLLQTSLSSSKLNYIHHFISSQPLAHHLPFSQVYLLSQATREPSEMPSSMPSSQPTVPCLFLVVLNYCYCYCSGKCTIVMNALFYTLVVVNYLSLTSSLNAHAEIIVLCLQMHQVLLYCRLKVPRMDHQVSSL
jgi:hypothetical protein